MCVLGGGGAVLYRAFSLFVCRLFLLPIERIESQSRWCELHSSCFSPQCTSLSLFRPQDCRTFQKIVLESIRHQRSSAN